MQAIVVNNRCSKLIELPLSPVPAKWVRLCVEAVGICGTDLSKLNQELDLSCHTPILGHEFFGKVQEIGDRCSGNFSIGDWVVGSPLIKCGECFSCQIGTENLCSKGKAIGRTHPGAFAEDLMIPEENLIKISKPLDEFVLSDPLAVCIHALSLLRDSKPREVLVIGDGAIGSLLAWLLNLKKWDVVVLGRHPENLSILKEKGIKALDSLEGSVSFDVVFEAVGRSQSETIESCFKFVRSRGEIIGLGVFNSEHRYSFKLRDFLIREVSLIGSNAYCFKDFESSVALIETHHVDLANFITGSYPLADFSTAIAHAQRKLVGAVKIILRPGGSR